MTAALSDNEDATSVLKDALAAHQLEAGPVEGFPAVLTAIAERASGRWSLFAQTDQAAAGVLVYSVFPRRTPEDRRPAMAEFGARVNYLLRYGDIEMDFDDGEVRVRTSARGGPEPLSFFVAAELVAANLEASELVFPAIEEVALKGRSPSEALADVLSGLTAETG